MRTIDALDVHHVAPDACDFPDDHIPHPSQPAHQDHARADHHHRQRSS
jgi:hypothetical protein